MPRLSRVVPPSALASTKATSEEQFDGAAAEVGLSFEPLPVLPNGVEVTWFGRRLAGANVAELTAAQQQIIVDATYRFGLVHVPRQTLTPHDEIRLATLFDHDPANVDEGHPVKTISRLEQFPCIVVQGLGVIEDHHGIEHRELQPFPTFKHMWHTVRSYPARGRST